MDQIVNNLNKIQRQLLFYYYFFNLFNPYFQWLGALNVRKVVEAHLLKAKESSNEKNIQELDNKLKKLLLTDDNKNDTKKEK